jgi:hypothetical protein
VDKYIWTVIAADEAVAFRVIEPLDRAFHHSTAIHFMFVPNLFHKFPNARRQLASFQAVANSVDYFFCSLSNCRQILWTGKFRPNFGVRFIPAPPSCRSFSRGLLVVWGTGRMVVGIEALAQSTRVDRLYINK